VLEDCRKFDRKRGLSNDLDASFVKNELAKGCQYCGETAIRMTLDRVRNDEGHLRENVVPACLRCNLMRGSMPWKAWLFLVPKVREAREMGLFGSWGALPFAKRYSGDQPAPPEKKGKSKNFPPLEEVASRVAETSLRAVAAELGCSHVAVWHYLHGRHRP
jgi:hypothetical protein